jgi:2-phospho-L-lactate/phosphoenolpyruvate guanylyltransferase
MSLCAIIPIKPLARGKSRLSGVLTRGERMTLNRKMLIHTIEILNEIPEVSRILVISRDTRALALARQRGAHTVLESKNSELNSALGRATYIARKQKISGVLVLPADLPMIVPQDIEKMIERSGTPPVVVIAPDRHRRGTNAILVSPAGLIQYEFGVDSFEKHCLRVREAGARLEIVELSTLALDIDNPEDLSLVEMAIIEESP